MASASKLEVNFKVDNVDTLNTHVLQILSGKSLTMPEKTKEALIECVNKKFETFNGDTSKDFLMVDGKGVVLGKFQNFDARNINLKTFLEKTTPVPAQESFKKCDKIIKCTKVHQQQMAHMRMPSMNFVHGGISKVCAIPLIVNKIARQGNCIYNALMAMSYFVREEDDELYASIVKEVLADGTAWPKLERVSKMMHYIIMKLPYLAAAPMPAIAVDHERSLIHICDQRGVPQQWHVLKIGTAAELANAGLMKSSNLINYFVGGTNQEIVELYSTQINKAKQLLPKWIKGGDIFDDITKDVNLAAFMMMSPSMLSKLQNVIHTTASEALNLEKLETSHENKIVAINAIQAALAGIRVRAGCSDIEKVWLHIHSIMMNHFDEEENKFKAEMRLAVTRLYAAMIAEKKYVTSCERAIYRTTKEEFLKNFGLQQGFVSKLSFTHWRNRRSSGLGYSNIKLKYLEDPINSAFANHMSRVVMLLMLGVVKTGSQLFSVTQFFFYIFLVMWGSMSLSNFIFYMFKSVVISRLSGNYKKLMLLGSVFVIYELAMYIKRELAKKRDGKQTLQFKGKESEKKMMAAMAMATLAVHAFDIDLAIMMSNSLHHVSRLVSLLSDSTTGWLVRGGSHQELQMKFFELALEVDDKVKQENELEAQTSTSMDTFASWINEQIAMGNDNTRPLVYGRNDEIYKLNKENASEVGATLTQTKRAWSQVVGQTGSGKSTKVPMSYYNTLQTIAGRRKNILICEPTQATTQNVAAALSHFHGKSVYFKHEGKEQHGDTSIQVMTYGSAFFRSINNPGFVDGFDAVFLDESHLVTSHSLAMEAILNKHTTVRKFYLSATPRIPVDVTHQDRRFQIYEHTVEKADVSDFIAALNGKTILDALEYGDKVLVFLSGKNECDKAAAKVNGGVKGVSAISLHKDNFKINYAKVCQQLEMDGKYMIFATNILETGVTLNVDVVVDFGYTNVPDLNLSDKTLLLRKRRVTKAERQQRIGRAGRLRDGHAIVIGKTTEPMEIIPANVVYEAALLSFIYNLDIYINTHFDHTWLSSITRAQAKTMANFRVSPFVMRDLVFADGSVRPEVLSLFKKETMNSTSIKTRSATHVSHITEAWPKLGAHIPQGETFNPLSDKRVSFITHDLLEMDLDEVTKALAAYQSTVKERWGKPIKEAMNVIMHVNQENIYETLAVARVMRSEAVKSMQQRQNTIKLHRNSPLSCLFGKKTIQQLEEKLGQQVRLAQRNLTKIDKFIGSLEMFATVNEHTDEGFEVTPEEMDNIGACMELQMNTTCNEEILQKVLKLEELPSVSFRDAIIVGREKVMVATMILCVAAFSGLAWWLMWDEDGGLDNEYNKEQHESVYTKVLEMKGKAFNRDKRSEASLLAYEKADVYGENLQDVQMFKSKRGKSKKMHDDSKPLNKFLNAEPPFISLYDITTDDNIVSAVFQDTNRQAFYETANPLAHMKEVEEHLQKHIEKGELIQWADAADDTVYCVITKNDGTVMRVKLTPHQPNRVTNTFGTMGYHNKAGQYRQTGPTEILKHPPHSLEIATHLQTNQINLDVGSMIGIAEAGGGQINCILYKDFIILPAHVMLKSLPIKFTFKHAHVIVSELPQAYSFPGFDIIVVKRPTTLPPVKCVAYCGIAHENMVVQMLYKKLVSHKLVTTITAPIHQTKEHRWAHQIPTENGMCGCPVLDVATGKIVGIHVMGDHRMKHNVFETLPPEVLTLIQTNDKKVHQTFHRNQLKAWVFQPEMHGYLSKNLTNLQMNDTSIKEEIDEMIKNAQLNERLRTMRFDLLFQIDRAHCGVIDNNVVIKTFSRDTSIYKIENFRRSAECGGLFKPREITKAISNKIIDESEHMDNMAYSHAILNTKHVYVGENPYWIQFKANHKQLVQGIEKFEDNYLPSELTYNAYWKDLLKYNRPLKSSKHDEKALLMAIKKVVTVLEQAGMRKTRIKTPIEVLSDVQWNKAAGPMYGVKKRELCMNMTEEELITMVIHSRNELVKGQNAGIWNGSLKAELRPIEKVNQHKTRVFTAAPITTLLGSKCFVDDSNKQFYNTHLKAPHTVGINKFQKGWERVHDYLNTPGWLHGSGDGSRFDASIDPFLFDAIYSIRLHFMDERDQGEAEQALSHMYREFVFTPIHTVTGNIIMKKLGNNSGQPSTVVDNTLVLMLSFYYAYIRKTGDFECEEIENRFKFVCNGDDNKFSISPEFAQMFGGDFSQEITELGLKYEFDELTKDITENPYMSLTMIRTKSGIGFQLNPERIVAIVQWAKKGGLIHAAQSAFAALVESYNGPWLFSIMNLYMVWLLSEYKDAFIYAEENGIATICYMDPCQIHALHYARAEDSGTPYYAILDRAEYIKEPNEATYEQQQLQMKSDEAFQTLQMDFNKKEQEEKEKKEREEKEGKEKAEAARKAEQDRLAAERREMQERGKQKKADETRTESSRRNNKDNIDELPAPTPDQDPVDEDGPDIQWALPAVQRLSLGRLTPKIDGRRIWNAKVLNGIPREQFRVSSALADDESYKNWEKEVKDALKIRSERDYQTVLTAWCLWCANNGTSSEVDTTQDLEVFSGDGKVLKIPIRVFTEPAVEQGGLRKIMRRLSEPTTLMLKKGNVMTAWGTKRGFTQKSMIPYAFDFYVQTTTTPKTVREQLNQAKAAAIGKGVQRVMLLDGKIQGSRTSYERHVDTDKDEYSHGDGGEDTHPHLY
ncbi:polyprotein [Crow-dipper mosaic virus]|nr:polyprotein [Crow-dipper mosaic virus]